MTAPRSRANQGMALALVLAGLVILSMISITLISSADRAVTVGNAVVERARATALAEGAVETAILSLFAPDTRRRLRENDGDLIVQIAGTPVTTHIRDACGLWDINKGDTGVLSALLNRIGGVDAGLIIDAMTTARRVDAGLLSVDQVRALPGMNADAYRRLAPEITVNCRADRIDPEFASPMLLGAIPGLTAGRVATIIEQRRVGSIDPGILAAFASYLAPGPGQTYEIVATMGFGPGSRVTRRADVALTHQPGQPYRVLAWSSAE